MPFSPAALIDGRIARGYNKAQLASLVGISRQAMSLIEKGENEPKPDTLSRISDILCLPLKYFHREPNENIKKESATFYRKLSKAQEILIRKADVQVKWHYNGYLELTKYLQKIDSQLPKFCYDESYDFKNLTEEDLENYAKSLREFWGLGLGPIVGLSPLLEKNGILLFQINVSPEINGFSFYANGKTPFIICSNKVSATRNRFNLAHELTHILFHAPILNQDELQDFYEQIENQADYFAGAFLFPAERFIEEFFSTDLKYLISLKQRWGVSITAIIQRAFNLGILSKDEVSNFYKRNGGIRKKEPLDNDIKIEHPTFPKNGLELILDHKLITVDDVMAKLPYNNKDLSEIFYQNKSFFDPKQDTTNIFELGENFFK